MALDGMPRIPYSKRLTGKFRGVRQEGNADAGSDSPGDRQAFPSFNGP
jgi:hypothetical protein